MTITALIPCHNMAHYLRATLESVLAQTLQPSEIILVDDCSTDGTLAIMQEIAAKNARIKVIALPENRGVVAARNAALAVATGAYIAMLDGDDLWTPDALAVRATLAQRFPHADLIATDFAWFEDEPAVELTGRIGLGPRGRRTFSDSFASGEPMLLEEPFEAMATTHFVWTGATLIKRAALAAVNDFDPTFTGPEDTLLWLRLAQRGAFVFSPRITSMYRQRAGSLVTLLKGPKELHYVKVLHLLRRMPEFKSHRKLIDRLSSECHVVASRYFARIGDRFGAGRHAAIAAIHCPSEMAHWRNFFSAWLGASGERAKS